MYVMGRIPVLRRASGALAAHAFCPGCQLPSYWLLQFLYTSDTKNSGLLPTPGSQIIMSQELCELSNQNKGQRSPQRGAADSLGSTLTTSHLCHGWQPGETLMLSTIPATPPWWTEATREESSLVSFAQAGQVKNPGFWDLPHEYTDWVVLKTCTFFDILKKCNLPLVLFFSSEL